ncbi:MAG: hypothetical protein JNL62_16795 [Bryobacterales bacterium]|nr:hypothetical protein [Bryobacterales bacterium]
MGPSFADLNIGIHKTFRLSEHARAELRAEAFNALNRTNYDAPVNKIGNAAFGNILTAADARQFQLLLRFTF